MPLLIRGLHCTRQIHPSRCKRCRFPGQVLRVLKLPDLPCQACPSIRAPQNLPGLSTLRPRNRRRPRSSHPHQSRPGNIRSIPQLHQCFVSPVAACQTCTLRTLSDCPSADRLFVPARPVTWRRAIRLQSLTRFLPGSRKCCRPSTRDCKFRPTCARPCRRR